MAIVRFGQGVAEMRGSIGGTTFSRSRNGATARNRITPVNPNTQAQADFRYLFATVAAAFSQLSQTQRDAWDEYAQLLTFWTNALGEAYTPSGRQVFQYCATNLCLSTLSLVSGNPPSYLWDSAQIPTVPDQSLTAKPDPPLFANGDKTFTLTLTAGAVTAFASDANLVPPSATTDKQVFLVEATPVMNPTVRNRANRYRALGIVAASAAAPVDILTSFVTRYNQAGLSAGQTAMVRMRTINLAGLASDWVEETVTAA